MGCQKVHDAMVLLLQICDYGFDSVFFRIRDGRHREIRDWLEDVSVDGFHRARLGLGLRRKRWSEWRHRQCGRHARLARSKWGCVGCTDHKCSPGKVPNCSRFHFTRWFRRTRQLPQTTRASPKNCPQVKLRIDVRNCHRTFRKARISSLWRTGTMASAVVSPMPELLNIIRARFEIYGTYPSQKASAAVGRH